MRVGSVVLASVLLVALRVRADENAPVPADDPVLRAMADEIARFRAMQTQALDSPYYIAASVAREETFEVEASFGALVSRNEAAHRAAFVDVRVGSPALDNHNFADREHPSFMNVWLDAMQGGPVPVDADYDALRQALWLRIDSSYKRGVETLARKRAYLATNTVEDRPDDFTPATLSNLVMPPAVLHVDKERWTRIMKSASAIFRDASYLHAVAASFHAHANTQSFVTSDPARNQFSETFASVRISASGQASDGMDVGVTYEATGRTEADLPSDEAILKAARDVADRLKKKIDAPAFPDDYSGPVLLIGPAAGRFFLDAIAAPLSHPRELLGETRAGGLVERLGKKIGPAFLTVRDDPTKDKWKGQPLLGYFPVDDEGVTPQPITLVDKGTLKTCYMSRTPIPSVSKTNGHARGSTNAGSAGNLFVESTHGLARAALKKKLLTLVKQAGLPYGIIIEDSAEGGGGQPSFFGMQGGGNEGDIQLARPTLVYRLLPDGREELVRGPNIKKTSFRVIDDIVALGSELSLLNTHAEGQQVSVVAPDVLVRQLDLTKPAKQFDRMPGVPRPDLAAR
jgi:predicted Zn-dependent protease